ncbi:MAG: VOC family protein [Myxococcota bacterium]
MKLGCFSVSLAVKDLATSKAFYRKLGFDVVAGDEAQNYLILQNGTTKIGLFQGMFEDNLMTFNPGWGDDASPLESFTDIREIKTRLEEAGIAVEGGPEGESGPGHCVIKDPDVNTILLDQHV